jgi:Amt family ammonium transporter
MTGKMGILWLLLGVLAFSGLATADDGSSINAGDTVWVLVAAALVMLMTPAVGFFYGGMVRGKNVLSVMTQSFAILAIVSVLWVLVGYSIAFGPDVGGVTGNLDWAGLNGVGVEPNPDYSSTIPQMAFMVFQLMFAVITPALIIGAFADRMKFATFIMFVILWSVFVYAPLAHWVWGAGGWLRGLGALDFAGGTVVHISAGMSAVTAALIIGRRAENKDGNEIRPHNITMTVLGASLLWFGWFGFNAGSALAANGLAVQAFVATNMAAAAAAISWMLVSWKHTKKPSSLGIVTGAVCGLVAITPAAGFVSPIASMIIGAIAGAVCYWVVWFMKNRTKIDDALDVFACHGIGGVTGALLTGVFAQKLLNPVGADGLLSGNASLLGSQAIAVLATIVFATVMTATILKLLDKTMGLRVRKEEEIIGLDLAQHGEEAYPDMDIPG